MSARREAPVIDEPRLASVLGGLARVAPQGGIVAQPTGSPLLIPMLQAHHALVRLDPEAAAGYEQEMVATLSERWEDGPGLFSVGESGEEPLYVAMQVLQGAEAAGELDGTRLYGALDVARLRDGITAAVGESDHAAPGALQRRYWAAQALTLLRENPAEVAAAVAGGEANCAAAVTALEGGDLVQAGIHSQLVIAAGARCPQLERHAADLAAALDAAIAEITPGTPPTLEQLDRIGVLTRLNGTVTGSETAPAEVTALGERLLVEYDTSGPLPLPDVPPIMVELTTELGGGAEAAGDLPRLEGALALALDWQGTVPDLTQDTPYVQVLGQHALRLVDPPTYEALREMPVFASASAGGAGGQAPRPRSPAEDLIATLGLGSAEDVDPAQVREALSSTANPRAVGVGAAAATELESCEALDGPLGSAGQTLAEAADGDAGARLLLPQALVARAATACGGGTSPAGLAGRARAVIRERAGADPQPDDAVLVWEALETLCVVDGELGLDEEAEHALTGIVDAAIEQMTGPDRLQHFSVESAYGAARIQQMVRDGCAGAGWEG